MISLKTITAICLGATLCTAQAIDISGIVQDTAGVGIPGATVTLEKADITATTQADGSFTLTNGSTQIQQDINSRGITASPIRIQNGKIAFTLSENAASAISVHDVGGRQIYSSKRTYGSGAHVIPAPTQSTGLLLYRITIGNEAYSFKSLPFGMFSAVHTLVSSSTSTLAKQAKATAEFTDVISVIKEGQLDYRDSIKTSDTSGIIIKMIPNAGNVTDVDGNVYQSVRIGNQVWTVENLKTTRYNDGTPISYVPESGKSGGVDGWQNLRKAAYCYFDNDTTYKARYGALYNWNAAASGILAPEGWRVPTDADWSKLRSYCSINGYNWDGTMSGNKIAKSLAAKTDWIRSELAGTIGNELDKNNNSGFYALPGGYRASSAFFTQRSFATWWSATGGGAIEGTAGSAYNYYLRHNNETLGRNNNSRQHGYSVRLLRDLD